MTTASQRDVIFTPLMLRVRATLDRTATGPTTPRLQPSVARGVAQANDEWVYLRCRAEQVLAEANAMLTGRAELLDLEDEYGTGRLAFALRGGSRSIRIALGRSGRTAWVELSRSYAMRDLSPIEPESPEVLEDLVVELIATGDPTDQRGAQQ